MWVAKVRCNLDIFYVYFVIFKSKLYVGKERCSLDTGSAVFVCVCVLLAVYFEFSHTATDFW